jgi:hypothetical protein
LALAKSAVALMPETNQSETKLSAKADWQGWIIYPPAKAVGNTNDLSLSLKQVDFS